MSRLFEELDYCPTPIGALSLRRRHDARLGREVYEILLGEAFLMTSHFVDSEVALATYGVSACRSQGGGEEARPDPIAVGTDAAAGGLDVVVGGLGLGYTARAALDAPGVADVRVVEFLAPVIEWHEAGLLPLGRQLVMDPRCHLVTGDFFAMAAGAGFDPQRPGRRFDAILADIDHAPDDLLDGRSKGFYQPDGLRALARFLKPGGVFGLWSDAATDPRFLACLEAVFPVAWAVPVRFDNPLTGREVTQTVYLARTA